MVMMHHCSIDMNERANEPSHNSLKLSCNSDGSMGGDNTCWR